MNRLFVVGAAAAAIIAAFPANAAVVISGTTVAVGGSKTIYFNGFDSPGGTPVIAGLTSTLTLTLLAQTPSELLNSIFRFSYDLYNSSSAPVTQSRVSGFGFEVDPNLSTAKGNANGITGTYDHTALNPNQFPNSNINLDVCFNDANSPQGCNGGGSGGAFRGEHATGQLTLDFIGANVTEVSLSNFLVRYQSITGVGTSSAIGQQVPAVPESATWAMMLVGFGFLGTAMRRKRNTTVTGRLRLA